jgi:hypothetical protein
MKILQEEKAFLRHPNSRTDLQAAPPNEFLLSNKSFRPEVVLGFQPWRHGFLITGLSDSWVCFSSDLFDFLLFVEVGEEEREREREKEKSLDVIVTLKFILNTVS